MKKRPRKRRKRRILLGAMLIPLVAAAGITGVLHGRLLQYLSDQPKEEVDLQKVDQPSAENKQESKRQQPKKNPDEDEKEEVRTENTRVVEEGPKKKGIVAIDPGHQGSWVDMSALEPDGPGSAIMKAKATTGTQGSYTGIGEYELNLDISLMLAEELKSRGYEVVLTRTDNDTAISNAQRAILANESGADILIRIHANGSEDAGSTGALAMAPGPDNVYVGNLSEQAVELADIILSSYCSATGMGNQGVQANNTMTGMNWSKIPVMILEMGYMTNESDDRNMADSAFRQQMVKGIADGVDRYYSKYPSAAAGTGDDGTAELESLIGAVDSQYLAARCAAGEKWAVKVYDLTRGKSAAINGDLQMRSASVIKLFIMAAVYDRVYHPGPDDRTIDFPESYDGELEELLTSMITVSDNDAANTIVERLGNGSFESGMGIVNAYCMENGYQQTSLGRRFLGDTAGGDNYTSVNDSTALVASIVKGTCVNAQASERMLEYLKNQTRRNKIPAGILDDGAVTANKTGELSSAELGYVENDICIVWGNGKEYILCVFSDGLNGENASAIMVISEISRMVYDAM